MSDLNLRLGRLEAQRRQAQPSHRALTPEQWQAVYAAERAFLRASEAGRDETALQEAETSYSEMLASLERARREGRGEAAPREAEEADAAFQRILGWKPASVEEGSRW